MAVPFVAFTRSTLPCLPRSLPDEDEDGVVLLDVRLDAHDFLSASVGFPYILSLPLDDFRRQRDDLHELPLAQLAGDRAEDARADRLACVVDENGRVVVEFDVEPSRRRLSFTVRTMTAFTTAPFLTVPSGEASLTEAVMTSPRRAYWPAVDPPQHLDAGDLLRAGVVGDLQNSFPSES